MSNMERKYDFTKEQYITEIDKLMHKIDWLWLLDMIYQFAVNVTREDGNN